ncbi:hypothetical protein Q2941_50755, partial [Bradyrhizobium sp. UFLA05-153]
EQPDHRASLGDSNAVSHSDEVFGTHRRLLAMLDQVSGQHRTLSQKEAVAMRLIELLPSPERDPASIRVSETHGRMLFCLVLWWSFLLATTVFSNYKSKVENVSAPHSSATVLSRDESTNNGARNAVD